jgi:hypothetical protein
MASLNICLQLTRAAVCAGVAVFIFIAGAASASASDWSYCQHRYGPSLVTITRDINGTPCGINCTARANARWAKERRCAALLHHARRHGDQPQ